jgi:uncharacterized repeat protein (TIGR03837 family)
LAGRTKWFFYPGFTPHTGGLLREPGLMERQQAWQANRSQQAGHAPTLTLFCYEPARLAELLQHPDLTQAHWQVAPGRAAAAFGAALAHQPHGTPIHWAALPFASQQAFDETLWASDLNLVRGEDSLVRALWAGQALVWQIYPQDDHAHHAKLNAFLDWLDAPADLRQMHHVWNGMDSGPLPALGPQVLQRWRDTVQAARQRLLAQDDLTTS